MITAFNTDIKYDGKVYHVQTEDKGVSNPVIETLIYVGGEILTAKRSSYEELVREGQVSEKAVTELLENQHKRMIREVREGRHDPDGLKPIGVGLITDRSLDEVVLDYIDELLQAESVELTPLSDPSIREGTVCRLQLMARGNLTGRPIRDAQVTFQLLSPPGDPVILLQERSGKDGVVTAELSIPSLQGRSAKLLAEMQSDSGEARWENAVSSGSAGEVGA